MLLLHRRSGDVIRIGRDGEIAIHVLAIAKDCVLIGIEAPSEMPVHRQEVFDAIHEKMEEQP